MISTVVSLPLALLLLALLARQIRIYYALNAFGGHWSAGWSRLWLLRTQRSGVMNRRFTDINRKYGESVLQAEPETRLVATSRISSDVTR